MKNPQTEIKEIVRPLYEDSDNLDAFGERNELCIHRLTELAPAYDAELVLYMRQLLARLPENEWHEFVFIVMLQALAKRNRTADMVELAAAALLHDLAEDKRFYAELLAETDDARVAPVFIKALHKVESFDEDDGYAQETMIEFLHRKRDADAIPAVIHTLGDVAARVRASALLYIKDMDARQAAEKLLHMLDTEDWEYNILLILELLKKWNKNEYIPHLQTLYTEEWVQENEEIRLAFLDIIK